MPTLRTADFSTWKNIRTSRSKANASEKGQQLLAVGTFTMRGVSKKIALPFSITGSKLDPSTKKMSTGYAARFTLNRREFGVYWEKAVPHFRK